MRTVLEQTTRRLHCSILTINLWRLLHHITPQAILNSQWKLRLPSSSTWEIVIIFVHRSVFGGGNMGTWLNHFRQTLQTNDYKNSRRSKNDTLSWMLLVSECHFPAEHRTDLVSWSASISKFCNLMIVCQVTTHSTTLKHFLLNHMK